MQIAVNLPNDFVNFQPAADIEKDMRLSFSLWLFKNARVTLAKAAEMEAIDRDEAGMILVADCSALIAPTVCDCLDLLERLFDSVVAPESVYHWIIQGLRRASFFVRREML